MDFDFEEGDKVLVRVRENGTSGNIIAKFEAVCKDISGGALVSGSPVARFELPWGKWSLLSFDRMKLSLR